MTGVSVRIEADLLIPGRGDPIRDGVVILSGKRIEYAGSRTGAPVADEPGIKVRTVMPGLWDCHAHFAGLRDLDLERVVREPQALQVARAAKAAEDVLRAGFTSVRDCGGYGIELARAVEEGTIAGPNIYGAGAILSQTGGHGDLHGMPVATVCEYAERGGWLHLCDGIAECQKAVRLQLRKNARFIKICASGGVLSEVDHPVHQQFSDDELKAIVDEASRADRIVAAHCHGKPGIMAALRAGCRTIEHGTYIDDEVAAAMRESNAILVATRSTFVRIMSGLDQVPPHAAAKVRVMGDHHLEAMRAAREAGVTVACGTDFSTVGAGTLTRMGENGEELEHLVSAGYTPLEAIEAATANGPLTLGAQAPRAGMLMEGYDADVIALDVDPFADIRFLADPQHVTHVWRGGHEVKSPA